MHIYIAFDRGARFRCPVSGCPENGAVYDSRERVWRHLNFFQYRTYLYARLPRVDCPRHGAQTVEVPWARNGSGFTLLFESWVLALSKYLPIAAIARMVGEHDTRLWRFITRYVTEARAKEDYET